MNNILSKIKGFWPNQTPTLPTALPSLTAEPSRLPEQTTSSINTNYNIHQVAHSSSHPIPGKVIHFIPERGESSTDVMLPPKHSNPTEQTQTTITISKQITASTTPSQQIKQHTRGEKICCLTLGIIVIAAEIALITLSRVYAARADHDQKMSQQIVINTNTDLYMGTTIAAVGFPLLILALLCKSRN